MGGRFAPANAATVARVEAMAEPPRSPFRAGLSYFPERPGDAVANQANFGGFGISATDVATVGAGVATGGVGGGIIAGITDLASAFSDGSTRDKQRAARANYFGNLAVGGNVAAAQLILGALVPNVSGNELPMWQSWLSQLQSSTQGQATLAAARQLGPYWPVGSSDTVTDYPIMKNFAATWAAQHPLANIPASVSGAASAIAQNPLPWLIGAGAIALLVFRRR
jgi:hypothetical protein